VRSDISSQHSRPPNYLISGDEDALLIREWTLVLRGDGKSPRTIEGYADSDPNWRAWTKPLLQLRTCTNDMCQACCATA